MIGNLTRSLQIYEDSHKRTMSGFGLNAVRSAANYSFAIDLS